MMALLLLIRRLVRLNHFTVKHTNNKTSGHDGFSPIRVSLLETVANLVPNLAILINKVLGL